MTTPLLSFLVRRPVVSALLGVVVLARIALPLVVEQQIETRVAPMFGLAIDVGDVDFGLLRGVVAADDVRIASPSVVRDQDGRVPRTDASIVWDRVAVNLRWIALLRGRVELSQVDLQGPDVTIVREPSGEIDLVDLFAPATTAEEAPVAEQPAEAADESAAGVPIEIHRLHLRRGRLTFEDRSVERGVPYVLEIDAFDVDHFRWPLPVDGEDMSLAIESVLDGGRLNLDAVISERDGALAVTAKLDVQNLRMVGLRAYTDALGWADLRGLVDADIRVELLGDVKQRATGSLTLREAAIGLPDSPSVPLRIGELALRDADVDVVARRLHLRELSLDGASLLADPGYGPLLPILVARDDDADAAAPPRNDDAPEPAAADDAPEQAAADDASEQAAADDASEPQAADWSWSVDRLRIDDTTVRVVAPDQPLRVGLSVRADGLSSANGAVATVEMALSEADGGIDLNGKLRVAPPAAGFDVVWRSLDLARLAAALPAAAGQPLHGAVSDGSLAISAGLAPPSRPHAGAAAAEDLAVSGTLSVSNLAVELRDGVEADVGCKRIAVELSSLIVAGVLDRASRAANAVSTTVHVADVSLEEPTARFVLGAADADAASEASAENGAQQASAAADETTPEATADAGRETVAPLEIMVDRFALRDGRFVLDQKGATEPVSATLTAKQVRALSIAWPQRSAREVVAEGSALKRGSWSIRGDVAEKTGRFEIGLREIPLPPLSPFTEQAIGLSVRRGALTLDTELDLEPDAFDSLSEITLHDLNVGGDEAAERFAGTFGMPLSLTLALLKDPGGDISIELPFAAERDQARVGLTTAFVGVMREVIVGAAASPLKLVGSVMLGDGKIDGFSIEPLDFAAGSATFPADGASVLAALVALVSERPDLALQPVPVIARADVRELEERALLDALEQDGDLGEGVPDLSFFARRRILGYLKAKAEGATPSLEAEDRAWLDAAVKARPEPRAALKSLLEARVAAISATLQEDYGLAPPQIAPASMPDEGRRKDGLPRVEFTLTTVDG